MGCGLVGVNPYPTEVVPNSLFHLGPDSGIKRRALPRVEHRSNDLSGLRPGSDPRCPATFAATRTGSGAPSLDHARRGSVLALAKSDVGPDGVRPWVDRGRRLGSGIVGIHLNLAEIVSESGVHPGTCTGIERGAPAASYRIRNGVGFGLGRIVLVPDL
jgi:hypothetical protein